MFASLESYLRNLKEEFNKCCCKSLMYGLQMKPEDPECNQVDADELPDLLEKGYRSLKFCGLHPHRLIRARMITLVVTGGLYIIPGVISSVFNIYEAMNTHHNVTGIMENLILPAGYTQVNIRHFQDCCYSNFTEFDGKLTKTV